MQCVIVHLLLLLIIIIIIIIIIIEYYMSCYERCLCCTGVIEPPNHPGGIALIYRENKDLSGNQSGNTEKLVKLVLRQVEINNSKWRA